MCADMEINPGFFTQSLATIVASDCDFSVPVRPNVDMDQFNLE